MEVLAQAVDCRTREPPKQSIEAGFLIAVHRRREPNVVRRFHPRPEHPAQRGVGIEQAATRIQQPHSDGCVLERASKARLQLHPRFVRLPTLLDLARQLFVTELQMLPRLFDRSCSLHNLCAQLLVEAVDIAGAEDEGRTNDK